MNHLQSNIQSFSREKKQQTTSLFCWKKPFHKSTYLVFLNPVFSAQIHLWLLSILWHVPLLLQTLSAQPYRSISQKVPLNSVTENVWLAHRIYSKNAKIKEQKPTRDRHWFSDRGWSNEAFRTGSDMVFIIFKLITLNFLLTIESLSGPCVACLTEYLFITFLVT